MTDYSEIISSLSAEERASAAGELLRLLDGVSDKKSYDENYPQSAERSVSEDGLPFYYDEKSITASDVPFENEPEISRGNVQSETIVRESMERISDFFSRDCRRYDRAFQIY